jgi:thiamine-phosphate pyrophosphorylase
LTAEAALEALSRTAALCTPRTARGIVLPSLLFFTDPARVADPEAVAMRLPSGSGVVFRAFGAPDAVEQGQRLRAITRARGLALLVGADIALAASLQADGVHLPERLRDEAGGLRRSWPDALITVAAHGRAAVEAASVSEIDGLVVSPVFASNSPSSGTPLGLDGLKTLVRATDKPVYALGGLRPDTVDGLEKTGIVGLAAVEALAGRPD